jgi:hypothetical protein
MESGEFEVTPIILPTPDGPFETVIISLPAPVFSDARRCTWLVQDMTGGVHDAYECEAPVLGRECGEGHPQIAGMSALNWAAPELS